MPSVPVCADGCAVWPRERYATVGLEATGAMLLPYDLLYDAYRSALSGRAVKRGTVTLQ